MFSIINNLPVHFVLFIFVLPILTMCGEQKRNFKGRFTENVGDYQLLVPHKINYAGEFVSFNLPHYYEHDFSAKRRKRDYSRDPAVHYKLYFNGDDHHLELFPNYEFLAPEAITERFYPGSDISVSARQMRKISPLQCHYTGKIRGVRSSSAAVSCCDGLSGYVQLDDQVYFIEPASKYGPNEDGHHLHLIHIHSMDHDHDHDPRLKRNCGAKNWRSGWADAFRYRKKMDAPVKKDPDPNIYYLEILVVVDKKFLDFHRDKDYENYILTVMNMASNLFHDGTTGQVIELNVDASKSLSSFCQWQKEVNPKEIEHPQHHDIAVLLTRQDICEGDESDACQLLGLAYFTQACNPSKSCSINEDSGLLLGIVVAHEIGHILGADHDTFEDSGCKAETNDDSYHIMGPIVKMSAYTWSKCSRKYFRELFQNGLGDCLMDEPAESEYKFSEMLPGSVYDADYQCRFFSANSSVCPISGDQMCQKLFCRSSNQKCRSYGDPPADGTKCGQDKWCYRRECVPIGKRPNSIAGGWSGWSNWSDCSRTCGGGIQFAERDCDNPLPKNGGLFCGGDHKKYQVCNKQPCGIGIKSYRAAQCSKFDGQPFAGQFYTWLPYTPARTVSENTCVLYCRRVNGTFAKLAPRAEDGTPCRKGTRDLCLSGACNKVGCDWKLDSTAIEDNCGVCNGDGKDCEEIAGLFTDSGTEYTKAIKIPKGARKIQFTEVVPSINFIAVQNQDGDFILNGQPDKEDAIDGEKNLDENLALYEHTEPKKEMLYIPGPTNQALTILVYFNDDDNVGYKYSYYIYVKSKMAKGGTTDVESKVEIEDTSEYHWENVDWSECSARCGGGESKSESKCISNSGGGQVNDEFCLKFVNKPETKNRVCNRDDCKISWHSGDWSPCSGCKHHPGAQFRSVWCAKSAPRWDETDTLATEQDCLDVDGPRPLNKQLCVDKCKKVNCRRGRAAANSNRQIEIDAKDLYNYRFFEKLFQKIDRDMKEPTDEVIELCTKDDETGPLIRDEPATVTTTETIPKTTPPPEPTTPIAVIDTSDNDTETQMNTVQNPDNVKSMTKETPKCPVRSIYGPRIRKKHTMFLFPRRREYRHTHKTSRTCKESQTQTPQLIVVKDKVPEGAVRIEEAKIKNPNTDFLSDYAYQRIGDRVTGSIDLDHEKVWSGAKAIVKIEKERKEING